MTDKSLTKKEIAFLKTLNTQVKIQEFINSLEYNKGRRVSIADVLRKRKADCLEAALFASLVFKLNGYKTFIMDLESHNDDDHVICVFKKGKFYGSVAQSKYLGLKSKSPVYKNLRELSMSYFEHFFNFKGTLDLKKRSIPLKLPTKNGEWITNVKFVHDIEEKLRKIKHFTLVPYKINIPNVSKEIYKRETLVIPKNTKIGKEYILVSKKIKRI